MLLMTPGLRAYLLFLTALLGLVMGSFLNCLAWRLARGESILRGRSHCARCGHPLSALDLVPLFSWLFLRGKCRYCGQKVSPRYPAVELLTALLYLSLALRFGFTLAALRLALLTSLLLAASLVDLDEGWIPDRLVVAGLAGFLLFALLDPAPLRALHTGFFGAVVLTVPLLLVVLAADKLLGRETMGGGDLKLLFVICLYFDWRLDLMLLILACVLGLILALILGKAKPGTPFPFGPALSLAAWAVALVGTPVLNWYLSLFF